MGWRSFQSQYDFNGPDPVMVRPIQMRRYGPSPLAPYALT
jgi:hypothetical protein